MVADGVIADVTTAHTEELTVEEMKYLYLIRHCETRELAGEEPPHPRNDSPLSQHGLHQAERLATFLRAHPIDLILTSLFQRAQATATLINHGRGVPIFASMALNEYFLRDTGRGVEGAEQGLVRSIGYLHQFSPYYAHIAVISHSSILATLLMSILNLPFSEGKNAFQRPGTCYILRYDYAQGDENWRQIDSFTP